MSVESVNPQEEKEPMRTALLSVTDKTGLADFASGLAERDFRILSTGGTARVLREAGLSVTDVSEVTGFPEMMDGRVKTLHPVVHGGLLGLRDDSAHLEAMEAHGISPIDLVAVNLYAFKETVADKEIGAEEAIEQIDIGGPSMIRSAAKNHRSVWVVTDPEDYVAVLEGLDGEKEGNSEGSVAFRRRLAEKAYRTTASYDAAIAGWFREREGGGHPDTMVLEAGSGEELRYGENPNQKASFYRTGGFAEASVATAEQLAGKALSYNNIMDSDAALELVKEFEGPAAAVIKHTNPCGCGVDEDIIPALHKAMGGDPQSAFGGIVAVNRNVDGALAEAIAQPDRFLEVVVAPEFDSEAIEILTGRQKWGKNLRLLACGDLGRAREGSELALRKVTGGYLAQDRDLGFDHEGRDVVTDRQPTDQEWNDLEFTWRVCKHVKSNAIVLGKSGAVVGVGAGQMSRVDSVFLAGMKSGEDAEGSVMASDAFFPFRDSVDRAHELGVTAVIQPGGSIKDKDSIAAADEHGMAMVFTGARHFRH